jgi:hypothetical protein
MAEKNVPGGFLGAGGLQLPDIDPVETLAATYAAGAAPAAQTMTLLDAKGGTIVMDGAGLTGAFPYTLSVLGNQFLSQSLAVGVNVGVVPTARIHVAGGSLNAGSASLKLDQGFLMTVAEPGAIESDGTDLWWTDSGSIRRKLTVQTLANAYGMGVAATDQTLILTNAKGGAFVINATTPGPAFTGVTAFEINVIGGSTNFYTKGGFDTSSSISVAAAVGAVWNEVNLLASTITLTGGPAVVTALSMVRVGSGVIDGAGNTVSDSYNLLIDAAPTGTATLTRAWSFGTRGASKFEGNVVIQVSAAGMLGPELQLINTGSAFSDAEAITFCSVSAAAKRAQVRSTVENPTGFGTLEFWTGLTALTEKMRISGNGNVGINGTAATASKFQVNASQTIASAAGAVYDGIKFATSTVSITGNTAITTAAGFNFTTIQAPTIAGNLATCAITNAATLTVTAAPIAGANVTITNPYALWVQAGNSKFDANVLVGGDIGATAAKTIALSNSATAPTTTVDLCHLYSADIAVGRATLAIFTEEAVMADIGLASTHSHVIFINGVKYKLMLVAA